jgi:general secretion pathway protein F
MTEVLSFTFQALRPNGVVESGVVEASSREAAVSMLGARGLFPMDIAVRNAKESAATRRVSTEDLAAGLRALAALLRSNLPLSRALAIMPELAPPRWAAALPGIHGRIEQGESLATALEGSSLRLPSHVIGIVRAGDAGSGMAGAVDAAALLLESRAMTEAGLRSALAYPMILLTAGSASVVLLVTIVLPRFAEILADSGQALPTTTRIVLGVGRLAPHALAPLAVIAGMGALLWRAWIERPGARIRWHAFLLSVPLVGAIRRSSATANAASTLAALLRAGVPLGAALPHAGRAAGDAAIETVFMSARDRVSAGESLSAALTAGDVLPVTTIRLIRVGEEAGDLTAMLSHAADIESTQAARRLQRVLRLIEPMIIVVLGGIVMVIAAALLQAMYGFRLSQ